MFSLVDTSESRSEILRNFEMWCWRRMEKISWTDRVRNEEVLHRVKEERNIVHTIKRRKKWPRPPRGCRDSGKNIYIPGNVPKTGVHNYHIRGRHFLLLYGIHHTLNILVVASGNEVELHVTITLLSHAQTKK
jgi:hypothetical protein